MIIDADGNLISSAVAPALPNEFVAPADPSASAVYHSLLPQPERAGLPFHLVSAAGRIDYSFGADASTYRSDRIDALRRRLAAATRDSFWSVGYHDYVLEQWGHDRRLKRSLHVQRTWLENLRRDGVPDPAILGIRHEPPGRLWVSGLVFTRTIDPTKPPPNWSANVINQYTDTVLEVVDVDDGSVLARTQLEPALLRWANDYTYSFHENEQGFLFLDIWRPRVRVG